MSASLLQLVCPDGERIELPSVDSIRASIAEKGTPSFVWKTLRRGFDGIPSTENRVSRVAAEICLTVENNNSNQANHDGATTVTIRVRNHNPLHLKTPGSNRFSELKNGSTHDWPINSTLYLLHSDTKSYPFELVPKADATPLSLSLSFCDPNATQDATPVPQSQLLMQHRATSPTNPPQSSTSRPSTSGSHEAANSSQSKRSTRSSPLQQTPLASSALLSGAAAGGGGGDGGGGTSSSSTNPELVLVAATPPPAPQVPLRMDLPATASQLPHFSLQSSQNSAEKKRQSSQQQHHQQVVEKNDMELSDHLSAGPEAANHAPMAVVVTTAASLTRSASKKRAFSEVTDATVPTPAASSPAASSAAAESSSATLPAPPSIVPPTSNIDILDDLDAEMKVDDFDFAAPANTSPSSSAGAAAAAAANDAADGTSKGEGLKSELAVSDDNGGNPRKKLRSYALVSKPSSTYGESAAPEQFLRGYAFYIVQQGLGAKRKEVLELNIHKHGGIILQKVPRHKFHQSTSTSPLPVVGKTGGRSIKRNLPSTLAPPSKKNGRSPTTTSSSTSSGQQLQIVLIFARDTNMRNSRDVLLALQAEKRREEYESESKKMKHLGVPISTSGKLTPPPSPSPASSAASSPSASHGSGSSSTTSSSHHLVSIRSTWLVLNVEWLISGFKQNAIQPIERYQLDDKDDLKFIGSISSRKLTFPASASAATSAASASAAASSDAATTDDAVKDEDESRIESLYADENDNLVDYSSKDGIANWNAHIASQLTETSKSYSAQRNEHFRAIAFRKAAATVTALPYALKDASQITHTPGIGSSILEEIRQILKTGNSARLAMLRSDPKLKVMQELQTVHGVGPAVALKMWEEGIRSIDDLRAGKFKLTSAQSTFLKYYDELRTKIPREEVQLYEQEVKKLLHDIHPELQLVICGSYRRGKPSCGDIDCLITHPDPKFRYSSRGGVTTSSTSSAAASSSSSSTVTFVPLLNEITSRMHKAGLLTDDLILPTGRPFSHSKNIYEAEYDSEMYGGVGILPKEVVQRSAYRDSSEIGGIHRRVDVKFYHTSQMPFAILYFTGSGDFNRQMRLWCNKRFDYSLSDKALTPYVKKGKEKVATGNPIHCRTEKEIFEKLRLTYVPPSERDLIPKEFLEP